MKTNAEGLALIKQYESCSLTVYRDARGIPTIGWGHTAGVTMNTPPIPQDRADRWLVQAVLVAEDLVDRYVEFALNVNQFSALVSFVYNVGPGRIGVKDGFVTLKDGRPSTLLKCLNHGWIDPSRDPNAADQFPLWVNAGGKKLEGLVKRRAAERALFLKPVLVVP